MRPGETKAPSLWRGIVAFAPMCALAALSWAELIREPPAGRIAGLAALAVGCGLVLAVTARLEPDGRTEARIVRVVTVAVCLVLGPVVAGVPAALLAPGGWEQLAAGLTSGVDGLPARWPYGGSDFWVRATVLLAIPVMTIPAAAFALWPPADGPGGREAAAVRRVGALMLLLSLIGFAGSERILADPVGRGALLLVAIVLWLFLPGLPGRPVAALAAAAAVLAAGLASLPVAAALAPGPGLVDGFSGQRSAEPRSAPRERGERSRPQRERRSESQRRSASGGSRRDSPQRPQRSGPSRDRRNVDDGLSAGLVILIVLTAALAVGVLLLRRQLRRSGSAGDEAEELRRALERLGWSVPPETTLAELERDLGKSAGPAAARYARRLRERRFGIPGSSSAPGLDRRALRSALTAGRGPLLRLRGLLALPPAALDLRR